MLIACLFMFTVCGLELWAQEKSTRSTKKSSVGSNSKTKKEPSLGTRAKNSAATSFGSSIGRLAGKDAYQNAKDAVSNFLDKSKGSSSTEKKKKDGN